MQNHLTLITKTFIGANGFDRLPGLKFVPTVTMFSLLNIWLDSDFLQMFANICI